MEYNEFEKWLKDANLDILKFCEKLGISPQSVFNWKRRGVPYWVKSWLSNYIRMREAVKQMKFYHGEMQKIEKELKECQNKLSQLLQKYEDCKDLEKIAMSVFVKLYNQGLLSSIIQDEDTKQYILNFLIDKNLIKHIDTNNHRLIEKIDKKSPISKSLLQIIKELKISENEFFNILHDLGYEFDSVNQHIPIDKAEEIKTLVHAKKTGIKAFNSLKKPNVFIDTDNKIISLKEIADNLEINETQIIEIAKKLGIQANSPSQMISINDMDRILDYLIIQNKIKSLNLTKQMSIMMDKIEKLENELKQIQEKLKKQKED